MFVFYRLVGVPSKQRCKHLAAYFSTNQSPCLKMQFFFWKSWRPRMDSLRTRIHLQILQNMSLKVLKRTIFLLALNPRWLRRRQSSNIPVADLQSRLSNVLVAYIIGRTEERSGTCGNAAPNAFIFLVDLELSGQRCATARSAEKCIVKNGWPSALISSISPRASSTSRYAWPLSYVRCGE
ncbi:hypothetical protein CYMTET_23666 [Cymbomonas tetramitiformis]|uniref:Uncharacterized protein n=1 Tax=Cymbomonas tetramitiformis TaxID=36881 RepID=A0AAE0FY10_9CHLO|nr:hypothetical protein CYMTET_23666 [Cymbomonas tetramitiformis]